MKDFVSKRKSHSSNKLKPFICKRQSNDSGIPNILNVHKFNSRYMMGNRKKIVKVINEDEEILGYIKVYYECPLSCHFGRPMKSKNKTCINKCGHRRNLCKSAKKQRRRSSM